MTDWWRDYLKRMWPRYILDNSVKSEQECWRICISVMLNNKLIGHLGSSLLAQNLLPGNPSLTIHEVHPVCQNICRYVSVPPANKEIMKTLVPQKASGEERPTGHTSI